MSQAEGDHWAGPPQHWVASSGDFQAQQLIRGEDERVYEAG